MVEQSLPPLIVIVGPTAVGKTEVSLHLAEEFDGEIVSADSRLFYKGMDIGTAKPLLEERASVPHHLIDVSEPGETWSLARFQQEAAKAIASIHAHGKLPFLVGGSGQYIHAVTHGWMPPIIPPNPILRKELETQAEIEGAERLHEELNKLDPAAAEKIDSRNLRRTIRALEVIRLTGRKFSEQRGRLQPPYRLLTIGLTRPRPTLYSRVDARIEAMFTNGLLDEVRGLLENGISPDFPAMTSIGYRDCAAVLQGKSTMEEAKAQMRRVTRVFIRRQANWFKLSDPTIHWFDLEQTTEKEIKSKIYAFRDSQSNEFDTTIQTGE